MQMHKSRGSLAGRIAVAVLAVMIAACNSDDEKSAAQPSGPSGSNGGAAPPPAPAPAPVVPPASSSRSATLDWVPPVTKTDGSSLHNLAGYRIYYGTDVAKLTKRIEVSNPGVVSYVVEGLAPATYYFAVTAIDAHGAESARSNAGRKEIS